MNIDVLMTKPPQIHYHNKACCISIALVISLLFAERGLAADTLYRFDVSGLLNSVPEGATAYGAPVHTGTSFLFSLYLDYEIAATNVAPLASGGIYFDPTHGTTITFDGGPTIAIPGATEIWAEQVGGPTSLTLTQNLIPDPQNPYAGGRGTAIAGFEYINQRIGSLDCERVGPRIVTCSA